MVKTWQPDWFGDEKERSVLYLVPAADHGSVSAAEGDAEAVAGACWSAGTT